MTFIVTTTINNVSGINNIHFLIKMTARSQQQQWLSLSIAAVVGASIPMAVFKWWASSGSSSSTDDTTRSPEVVLQNIQHRRSIFPKQYSTKQVPQKVLDDMLEAARWAPSHKLTEAWSFVVFRSLESRKTLGHFLAEQYKSTCQRTGKPFSEAKYKKKMANCERSSFVVSILCVNADSQKNPWWEELSSVAMAVQNMLLVAAAHKVGAYWSSGGVHDATGSDGTMSVKNSTELRKFLGLMDDDTKSTSIALGWMFVGDFYGDASESDKSWPAGRRKELVPTNRLVFK